MSSKISAAQLFDLKNHPNNLLQSFSQQRLANEKSSVSLKEKSRITDKTVTHIRVQEFYQGYPIWNANAVIHLPTVIAQQHSFMSIFSQPIAELSMNGQLYQQLDHDLKNLTLAQQQKDNVMQYALTKFKEKYVASQLIQIAHPKTELIIFVDAQQIAHWAYHVTFDVAPTHSGALPAKPVYIIDALNLTIYQNWDDIKTVQQSNLVLGGGIGGNLNKGQLFYDNLPGHLAAFTLTRKNNICSFENQDIIVKHAKTNDIMSYACPQPDPEHNQVYWSGNFDAVNGGFSPANDAMFAAQIIKQFYKNWYHIPVLVNPDGSEMVLSMLIHVPKLDNAYWNGEVMTFGDGAQLYPLTSLDIAAHEVSHGFTSQHANLFYDGQSGGMNEAFSDMAGKTAEYYAYGHNNWLIGGDVFKIPEETLRFMDQPSKDCYGKEPGTFCSIDSADQYYEGLDVHHSSGVYNRAFYLLSTMPNWNPQLAFAVMLKANVTYWLPQTQFKDGAACAIKSAQDLGYDHHAVAKAFQMVGIVVNEDCTNHDTHI